MIFKTLFFDTVASTNDTAKEYPVGTIIIATTQTAGRGRMGRSWHSVPGNLFMSAVVPDFGPQTPLLSFVAAVAVAKALDTFHPTLKWPNDVLIGGAKVCGILLEKSDNGVIVGIGLNVAAPPQAADLLYPVTALNGALTAHEAAQRIEKELGILIDGVIRNGFAPVLASWKKYAPGPGEKMTVRLPDKTITGIFDSLDSAGRLCLRLSDGRIEKIAVGDVFFNKGK